MASSALSLGLLTLLVAVVLLTAVPVQPASEVTALQPDQQPDALSADGKIRTARQLGIGVGVIGVGLGAYPAYPAYPSK